MIHADRLQGFGADASQSADVPLSSPPVLDEGSRFARARLQMVETQLRARGITDPRVLRAMGQIARQEFVPQFLKNKAYSDRPLPIGRGQTISQPYIVALMAEVARLTPQSRALEIGTGSGYQTAVLAHLCKEVYSVEIIESLAQIARHRLAELGYNNVTVRCDDGYQGWPEYAPFDAIMVSAAPEQVPPPLIEQLAPGGRLVIPVGSQIQDLLLLEKQPDGSVCRKVVTAVAFVPMTGEAQQNAPGEDEEQ